MQLQAALALISLVERAVGSMKALKGVAEVMKAKAEAGEEVTIDDLKQYQLADDTARDALVQAIEEAEEQG